jgi:hypothetical protein
VRFRFIAAERASHDLTILCRCLEVTRSGFYAWQHRPESRHAQRDRQLRTLIRAAHAESGHRYGSPRIYEDLVEQGEAVSRKRVVPRWTGQIPQFVDGPNPAFSGGAETGEFYCAVASARKSVWTFVRQLRGPHLSTCA